MTESLLSDFEKILHDRIEELVSTEQEHVLYVAIMVIVMMIIFKV